MANLSDERWTQAIEEHEFVMERLRTRDGEGLGQVMKRHMMNKHAALIRALDAETAGEDMG